MSRTLRLGQLRSSSRLFEAEWIRARLGPFGSGVGSIVPWGFSAYVRIFHPAHGAGDRPVRWAEVAAQTGRTTHRLAQFHAIARPRAGFLWPDVGPPAPGNLAQIDPGLLRTLCTVLAEHTRTPLACCFCTWAGHGWLRDDAERGLAPALLDALRNGRRLQFPMRDYLLFEGPLDAATEFGWTLAGERFVPESPNLFWPQDHAWCVATEVDLPFTLVAGSNALAEHLMGHAMLEAEQAFADDPVRADSDDQNRDDR